MKPNKILKQSIKSINTRTGEVFYPAVKPNSSIFGFPFKKNEDVEVLFNYKHQAYKTRGYRDKGAATYQLIRFLEQETKGAVKIFWRYSPVVRKIRGFAFGWDRYYGAARFSIEKANE